MQREKIPALPFIQLDFLSARGGARGASKYRLNGTFVEFVRHLCLVFWVLLYEFFGHMC